MFRGFEVPLGDGGLKALPHHRDLGEQGLLEVAHLRRHLPKALGDLHLELLERRQELPATTFSSSVDI